MRNYIYNITLFLLVGLFMVSCSENDITIDNRQCIELTVSCVNLDATRADGDSNSVPATLGGEDAYNENLIETLHYFLYPIDGNDDTDAVLVGKIKLSEGTKKTTNVRIPLNEEILNEKLMQRPKNQCKIYLIANFPDAIDVTTTENTSINQLKDKTINAFKDPQNELSDFQLQSSFVMDGQGIIDLVNRKEIVVAHGKINLNRFAVKYTASITAIDSYYDGTYTWTPVIKDMTVQLKNVVSNTTLAGTFGTEYFSYAERNTESVNGIRVTKPFYSYPCQWKSHENNALAMYITLPWQRQEGNTIKEQMCHYKVFPNTVQLNRNSWYNVNLTIGVLGTFDPEEEETYVEINNTCEVVDWNNGTGNQDWLTGLLMNSAIQGAHYLVVEQNHYVVNNKNTFEIPFITSHPCKIKDLKVKRMDFGTTENPTASPKDITSQATGWLTLVGNKIMLNHTLNNNFESTTNTNYDFTPYEFEFTLCHQTNETNFKEKITITQKPAISITAHLNSYREAYLAGKLPTDNNGTNGYQYVNGYPAGTNNKYDNEYGGAYGLYINSQSNTNKNPYMYTIEVTVLPKDSKYILGDPRWDEPATKDDNQMDLDFNGYDEAPGIESEGLATRPNRTLKNYYGTKTDASVENMIAPKFRIASSHGVTQPVSHTNAYNRAATYQEDGYPAGRWRVPTRAEVKFIIKLSRDGHIPTLFNTGSAYWCANGTVTPNNNSGISETVGTNGTNSVRCVYDDWYWEHTQWPRMASRGNHPNKYNQFTWGDEVQ